eukprot:15451143-Alexandrium_andersonii.AAC.1
MGGSCLGALLRGSDSGVGGVAGRRPPPRTESAPARGMGKSHNGLWSLPIACVTGSPNSTRVLSPAIRVHCCGLSSNCEQAA